MPDELIVLHKNQGSLGFYDLDSLRETDCLELDPYPHEFVLSADQRLAWVAQFGVALAEDPGPGGNTVAIVDLPRRLRLGSLDCGERRRPHGISMDDDGRLYVLSEAAGRLLVFSGTADAVLLHDTATGGRGSHLLSVTRLGDKVYCSNMWSDTVSVLLPREPDRVAKVIAVGDRPEGSLLDEDGGWLFVANRESATIGVIDTDTDTLVYHIPTPPGPVRLCWIERDRIAVALYHDCSLMLFDPSAPARQHRVQLPAPPVSVSVDLPTGSAFLSTLNDEVCVVALDTLAIKARIKTRAGPDPTAVIRRRPRRDQRP